MFDDAVLTIGSFRAGEAANVIPDTALLRGTLRAYDDNVRQFLKARMKEIATHIASAFRGEALLHFTSGCPTLYNDPALSVSVNRYMKDLLGSQQAFRKSELLSLSASASDSNSKASRATGSEDFAYFSHQVPSIMLAIAAGNSQTGCNYPLHHPEVNFDESVLSIGAAVYAYNALQWLEEQK
jgi:hippurate hydrolase